MGRHSVRWIEVQHPGEHALFFMAVDKDYLTQFGQDLFKYVSV